MPPDLSGHACLRYVHRGHDGDNVTSAVFWLVAVADDHAVDVLAAGICLGRDGGAASEQATRTAMAVAHRAAFGPAARWPQRARRRRTAGARPAQRGGTFLRPDPA